MPPGPRIVSMDEKRLSELSPALRAGRLEGMSLPDLLWALCKGERTGVLHVETAGTRRTIYFFEGQIVFATSSDPDDRLGERLLREGLISLEQLAEAAKSLTTGKRLGSLLMEAGRLTGEQLVACVLSQVEAIILELFDCEEGEYRFEEGALPTHEVITLEMKTSELLLRGIRTIRSFSRIRNSVGAPHTIYGLAAEGEELLEGLELSAGEELLLEHLANGEQTVEGLCREVFLSNFEIYQTLWGLKILGVVREREGLANSDAESHWTGSLKDLGFADLLVRLSRSRETGVLYVNRRHRERSFHIAEGRCAFATSSDPEDGLIAYLLRRGIISLSDREETARRLLSNKRVGTILRDMGVIDDAELQEMVKQQISEVVLDTFRWDDAYYAFMPGPLPTNEEITLEESLDRLVAEGLRRVTSWERVSSGCGPPGQPLRLTSSYLDVLDGMGAGPEEWQVVAALKEPRTIEDLCGTMDLGDFRICQILWALKVLGAVEGEPRPQRVQRPIEEKAAVRRIEVVDLDERPAASPDSTQAISRELVEASLRREEPPEEEVPPEETQVIKEFSPEATQIISRRMLEDALEKEAVGRGPAFEPEFEPPPDVDVIIGRFNNIQRLVYRAVRAEVGAGAVNFIRSCCEQLPGETADSLHGAELQPDGSWRAEDLKRAIVDNRISDPWSEYRKLIDIELDVLREHLGEAQASALRRQMEKVDEPQTALPPE